MSAPWDDPPDLPTNWEWDEPNTTADKPTTPRLIAVRADAVMGEQAPPEVVEGLAWVGCLTVLVAESSVGKTFVVLDLAAAISAGLSWHGRTVTQGTVVHIGFEGDAIGLRLRAMHEHRDARLEHVYRIKAADPLSPLVTRETELPSQGEIDVRLALKVLRDDLAATDQPPIVLIIIDTVRASLQGSEDSSEPVSAYLRAVRRILTTIPSAAALLVHHAGWQDGEAQKKRERGSSAFRGNVDATLYLEAKDYDPHTESAPLILTTHKVRDGEKPPPIHMVRQRVTFTETDAHGKPLSSCVIDPDPTTPAARQAAQTAQDDAEAAALDLRVLRAILAHPEATSQDRLSLAVGARKVAVNAALSRLLLAGFVRFPTKQRQPYTVTVAGRAALLEA